MAKTSRVAEVAAKAKPPIKWAGGKGQLLTQFKELYPKKKYGLYIEPFLGGGAVFFDLCPEKAVLMDCNPELINLYNTIKYDLAGLIEDLKKHRNEKDYYYEVRAQAPNDMTRIERASRFLFLNKTSFNGLWRVNKQGKHNVPFGKYKNPKILDETNLQAVKQALQKAEVILRDFDYVLQYAQPGAFVYLDPPYHPLSETASFTSYTAGSFGVHDQERLADVFRELDKMGCYVMLSNSDTPLIKKLYKGYKINKVEAKRAINCRADRRGVINELVVRNYM